MRPPMKASCDTGYRSRLLSAGFRQVTRERLGMLRLMALVAYFNSAKGRWLSNVGVPRASGHRT